MSKRIARHCLLADLHGALASAWTFHEGLLSQLRQARSDRQPNPHRDASIRQLRGRRTRELHFARTCREQLDNPED